MIMWNKRKYTKEEFIDAWFKSNTISDVAKILSCNASGGGYHIIKSTAEELNLSYDHMTGRVSGRKGNKKYSLEEILVENSEYTSTNALRKRLIKEGLLEEKCLHCSISEWMGQKAPLQLDHINGIRRDNRIENLRILCFNCHGQTPTFGSKNRKEIYPNKLPAVGLEENNCIICKTVITFSASFCAQHSPGHKEKISWPSDEELLDRLSKSNYTQLGKQLGVSDNAIRKRIKKYLN